MLGKSSFLDLKPSTMIHADSVSFLTSADDRIRKYLAMFGFPWKNPSVNSQWYIKQCVLWYGLGSIIMISACNYFSWTLQGLFWVFLGIRFSLSGSLACLVTCKSAKKWYLMSMCFSWLCPFNRLLISRSNLQASETGCCKRVLVVTNLPEIWMT